MKAITPVSRFLLGFFSCAVLVACWQQAQQPVQAQSASTANAAPLVALPDFSALVERTTPAVVSIEASSERGADPERRSAAPESDDEQMQEFFRRFFGQPMPGQPGPQGPRGGGTSYGSGFIISADGYVLTNHHVIEGMNKLVVHLADRRQLPAKLVGSDPSTDVAVLKIDAKGLSTLAIGDSDAVKPGQWVVAIGSPFGFDYSVTAGIVSALGRPSVDGSQRYVPFIQTDVAINRGNSGGPLLNTRGQVVGINSQIFSNSGGYMGVSFAIPIRTAMNAVEQIKATGSVRRGQLGVQVRDVQPEELTDLGLKTAEGAFVASVQNGSAAAKAGIQPGDVITGFNGAAIVKSSDLPPMVGALQPGVKSRVSILRNGRTQDIPVVLSVLDEAAGNPRNPGTPSQTPANPSKLGFSVEEVSPATRSRLGLATGGVQIARISQPMLGQLGIAKGDVVLEVGRTPVASVAAFEKAVSAYKSGDRVRVLIRNAESTAIHMLVVP
ncbi:Do family serine endopeptidase [Arenimonas sp. GDDSR-1]|uniref:Do family serine endopeptidase n=1 Tax=Arenimonas sp. GDDSR-1 TaxID=2950125 RepID=UPI002631CBA0|nr:Do family serine endopeptidase [Arenimonas sp. GDDSR-1]